MKRILFALPLLAVAAATEAIAANGLMVINHSGLPIDELSASAPARRPGARTSWRALAKALSKTA